MRVTNLMQKFMVNFENLKAEWDGWAYFGFLYFINKQNVIMYNKEY